MTIHSGEQMPLLISDEVRAQATRAFDGFIGNAEAIHTVRRSLLLALAKNPPSLDKTFLFVGPPSTGKSELARRIIQVLGVPFVRIDGRGVRSREKLFALIDESLEAHNLRTKAAGRQDGVPAREYPPFGVFIDEVHLVSEKAQEGFLTLLESDDRSVLLDQSPRVRVLVPRATFVFATTKPTELDRAFRSRCMEIALRRYTLDEVCGMVHERFPKLVIGAVKKISNCGRLVPRKAFALSREVEEEIFTSGDEDVDAAIRRVMNGNGILTVDGITRNDLRYLDVLNKGGRSMGVGAIEASLHDLQRDDIKEDVEPWLIELGYVTITSKGRELTYEGREYLKQAKQELGWQ